MSGNSAYPKKRADRRLFRLLGPASLTLASLSLWHIAACSPSAPAVFDAAPSPDAAPPPDAGREGEVEVLEEYDVTNFNLELRDDLPTADLAFYLTEAGPLEWSDLERNIERAQRIFSSVGVQLRVRSAVHIRVPADWQRLDPAIVDVPITPPELLEADLYRHIEGTAARPTPRTQAILEAIVANRPDDARNISAANTIHLISLREVPLPFYEWNGSEWVYDSVPTGALSLPPYSYAERMPAGIRGAITFSFAVTQFNPNTRILSHELGHKLINVSHEGSTVCPSFEADGPELMLYGNGEDIPAGAGGRYHQERLSLSPFLYTVEDGAPVFANAFEDGGIYRDGLYGGLFIDPPCGD
jgi:hypothetical protein